MNSTSTPLLISIRGLLIIFCTHLYIFSFGQELMRANLRIVPPAGNAVLMDGNLTNYDNVYSNELDMYDAWKMTNSGENFGIFRMAQNIVVERRKLVSLGDTTFFRMWNMQQRQYQLQVIMKNLNHPGLLAFLKDNYLQSSLMLNLNDTTLFNFTIDASAGSADPFRFTVVYSTQFSALPVRFTGINSLRKNGNVQISWQVSEQESVSHYEIEKSSDGSNFASANAGMTATGGANNSYSTDILANNSKVNFYRIKAVSRGGMVLYSPTTRLAAEEAVEAISVYPNPIVKRQMQLHVNTKEPGNYELMLINSKGMVYHINTIKILAGKHTLAIVIPPHIKTGKYWLNMQGTKTRSICAIAIL